jgi:hypothetical protein
VRRPEHRGGRLHRQPRLLGAQVGDSEAAGRRH